MKIAPLLLPILWTALPVQAQTTMQPLPIMPTATNANTRRIIESYRQLLLQDTKPKSEKIQQWTQSLTPEGNWTDIDYADQTVSSWKPLQHLDRVFNLYLALRAPESGFFGDEKLKAAAERSLHWWLLNKPTESQWYHREISVPRNMRNIIILAGNNLKGEDLELAMKQLGQFKVGGTGANLVWSADLSLHDAALRGDTARTAAMAARLAQEIKVGDAEGIQADWSFHQHGARQQTFHYGGAFFAEAVRLAWQLRGTPWAWPQDKIDILTGFALEGMRWQMRGNTTVPSTLDRAATRKGALRVNEQTNLRRLAEVDEKRGAELRDFIKSQNANAPAVLGFRWFPTSDFAAYHTPGSSFFLKTLSDRTLNSESINQENLLGAQLNLGDHYILRDGEEYFDLMGSWDWKQLPGVTWPSWADVGWPGIAPRSPFSGAATDGTAGVVAWQQWLQSQDKTRAFSVRNTVFVKGNLIVSLWSDVRSSGEGETSVQTTLEQSRLRGEVWAGTDKAEQITGSQTGLTWVNHNSTGYIALQPGTLSVSVGPHSGNWKAINAQYSADAVTDPTFTVSMPHLPGQTQGGYLILLNATAEQTCAVAMAPQKNWKTLLQTDKVQAMHFEDGTGMIAFFAPAQYENLQADRACTLFYNAKEVWASDPIQKGGDLNLTTVEGTHLKIALPPNGDSPKTLTQGLRWTQRHGFFGF